MIALMHLCKRFQPATVTARQFHISGQTIRNLLRSNQLKICIGDQFFLDIIEMPGCNGLDAIQFIFADGRIGVYRCTGERYMDYCIIQRDHFGGGSVMVWGGICGGRKTRLLVFDGNLNTQRYINEVLVPEVIPFLLKNGPVVVVLLFYVQSKHLRSCRDGQLT